MIRFRAIFILALASLMPSAVTYAADAQTINTLPNALDVVFFDVHVGDENGIYDEKCPRFDRGESDERIKHRIHFDHDGSVVWEGEKVDSAHLDAKLKSDLVADGLTELHILPAENAPSGVVVSTFKRIVASKFPCFAFMSIEEHKKIWRSKSRQTAPWTLNTFDISPLPESKKNVPLITIQITATDDSGRGFHDPGFKGVSRMGRCRAFLDDKPVSSDELNDMANKAMWNAINDAGGVEQFAKAAGGHRLKELIDVIILTTPNTPWRCINGSVFDLQRIGFLSIGFALMPDSQ